MMFKRVQRIAADLFELPSDQITLQSSPEEIASWDSVRHLNLVLALEQEFDLQFEPEEMDQMKTIGEITALLESKLSQGA